MVKKKKKKKHSKASSEQPMVWEQLSSEVNYESPWTTMSIIIPTYNDGYLLSTTLESILRQEYSDFEVIIVDANSQDDTLEIVSRYCGDDVRVYTVTENERYKMINHGISLSQGFYITCLLPGDIYISAHALMHMAQVIIDGNLPDLAYCGCIYDEGNNEPIMLLEQLSEKILRKGVLPCTLQSCWFRQDKLVECGYFNGDYAVRGDFELLCRLYRGKDFSFIATNRFLVDDTRRRANFFFSWRLFHEIGRSVLHYFGLFSSIFWLLGLRPSRIMRYTFHGLRKAFLGR